jgi:hypothetical protein
MAEPITIRARFEGGVFGPDVPLHTHVTLHVEAGTQPGSIDAVMRFVGSIKAPAGFDARKISREDLYAF